MNRQPIDITRKDNACASTLLCGFNEIVSTTAGRITPDGEKFRLEIIGAKRAKFFPVALTAIKKLRRASSALALAVVIYTLRGTSMLPLIQDGDRIAVEDSAKFDSLKRGQIAVYDNWFNTQKGASLTHRLLTKKANGWVTKGDNNPSIDRGLCSARNLLGVVIEVLPADQKRQPVQLGATP